MRQWDVFPAVGSLRAGWVWVAELDITCTFEHLLSLKLAFENQSSLRCWSWLGSLLIASLLPAPLAPPLGMGNMKMSWQHTCTKKGAAGTKIEIILEHKEKPVSRKAEVDLLCILTIYGVLMGLFKSGFTLLFNKKHIYHSNHLSCEEHILPPRWRPPSKRATAGICNVIFCATYNDGGKRRRRRSRMGEQWVLRRGECRFCKVSLLFLRESCFALFC